MAENAQMCNTVVALFLSGFLFLLVQSKYFTIFVITTNFLFKIEI